MTFVMCKTVSNGMTYMGNLGDSTSGIDLLVAFRTFSAYSAKAVVDFPAQGMLSMPVMAGMATGRRVVKEAYCH